jgi:hypothetical protein
LLHIATVHHRSPRWIEIQKRQLERHVTVPYETWASLEGIDRQYARHFNHVVDQMGPHADKLDHLALEIAAVASSDDLLLFLDGDAFPIADLTPLLTEGLGEAPLLAVRRAENADDPQPHPCFCLTTVGFWRGLPGSWGKGYTWTDAHGTRVSDVGATLLRALELKQVRWREVLRSNRSGSHALWFAIYGDAIYHHGAGFRDTWNISRSDLLAKPQPLRSSSIPGVSQVIGRINTWRSQRWQRAREASNREGSERVFQMIADDNPRWLEEINEQREPPARPR